MKFSKLPMLFLIAILALVAPASADDLTRMVRLLSPTEVAALTGLDAGFPITTFSGTCRSAMRNQAQDRICATSAPVGRNL